MQPGGGVPAGVGAVAALAIFATGCSTPLKQLKLELGERAAAELECAEPELRYKELDYLISTTAVQVTECGREATWKLVEGRWRRLRSGEPIR